MADFVIKLKGPVRSLELQIPIGTSMGAAAISTIKDMVAKEPEPEEEPKGFWKKKRKKEENKKSSGKIAATTGAVLLASLILSAIDD